VLEIQVNDLGSLQGFRFQVTGFRLSFFIALLFQVFNPEGVRLFLNNNRRKTKPRRGDIIKLVNEKMKNVNQALCLLPRDCHENGFENYCKVGYYFNYAFIHSVKS
jgi:hypothetical protein